MSVVLWTMSWYLHFHVVASNAMPFYDLSLLLCSALPNGGQAVLGWVIISLQAIHFNLLLNKHEVLFKQSWLPALVYLIIVSLLPPFLWFHPLLFVNSLLLLALDRLFMMYKNPQALPLVFNTAFILSMAALFYLPAISLFMVFAVGIIIFRPFSWREWIVGIIGYLLPFFYAFLYYFLFDELDTFYEKLMQSINRTPGLDHIITAEYSFSIVFTVVLLIWSVIRLQSNYYKNVTKARLIQQIFLLLIPIGFGMALIDPDNGLYRFSVLASPIALYLAYFFLSGKKAWRMEVLMTILISALVYNYFLS